MILFAVDTKKKNIESFQYLVQFAFKCFFLTLSSFDVSADSLCKNLDTDQERQNIRFLDANCFTLMAFLNYFF